MTILRTVSLLVAIGIGLSGCGSPGIRPGVPDAEPRPDSGVQDIAQADTAPPDDSEGTGDDAGAAADLKPPIDLAMPDAAAADLKAPIDLAMPDVAAGAEDAASVDGGRDVVNADVPESAFLNLVVQGGGSVRLLPGGSICAGACVTSYPMGTVLEVEVVDARNFVEWTGVCTGVGACRITMWGDQDVTANFNHGRELWSLPTGNPVAVGVSGSDIYVAGRFSGTTDFGGTQETATGREDLFIAKYSDMGSLIWVKVGRGGGPQGAEAYAEGLGLIALPGGGVVLHGWCSADACTVAGSQIGAAGSFVMRLSAAGEVLWTYLRGDRPNLVQPAKLAVDKSGDLVVGASSGSLLKIGLTGQPLWMSAPVFGDARTVATDPGNDVLVCTTGWQDLPAEWRMRFRGPVEVQGSGVLILKLAAADGALIWGTILSTQSECRDIISDARGDVYVLNPSHLAKLAAGDGQQLWFQRLEVGSGWKGGSALVVGASGDLMMGAFLPRISDLAREFTGVPDIGGGPVLSEGVVARYVASTGAWNGLAITVDGSVAAMATNARGDYFLATSPSLYRPQGRLRRVSPE